MLLLTGFQRLDGAHEHFVGHRTARAKHLGAPNGDSVAVLVADASDEEFVGLLTTSGAIWLGIKRQWDGIVNLGSVFFTIFLFCRLYHWWWDWMPKYLFFAIIGAIAGGASTAIYTYKIRDKYPRY